MSLVSKLRFYPTALALRFRLAATRSLLRGPFCWQALDALGVPGHGVDLLRVDFPPADDAQPRWGYGRPQHPELAALFETEAAKHHAWLKAILATAPDCLSWPRHEQASDPTLPWRDNLFLTLFDAAALQGMLRHLRPARYLEIGSGISTRIAWQARRAGGFPMRIVSVDPEPRVSISSLCDEVHRRRLENMPDEFLRLVTPGTVVFFDGSHRCLPASDVTIFFLEILPRLPKGTFVHIHDIYLPADYPARIFNRFWSEQYALAAYLLGGGKNIRVILPCAHLAAQDAVRPILDGALGPGPREASSFWLEVI